jgi:hypothetical protein
MERQKINCRQSLAMPVCVMKCVRFQNPGAIFNVMNPPNFGLPYLFFKIFSTRLSNALIHKRLEK